MIIGFHKFGHLALEPDLALLKIDDEKKKKAHRLPLDCYLWSLGPKHLRANRVLAELWGQRIRVIPSWLIDGFVRVGRIFPALELEVPKPSIHGPANRQISTPPPLHLSQQQEKEAKAAISEMGLNPNQPFVCLIVRDSGHNADPSGVENPGYEFRNFDIDVFSDAAIALSKRGYQVVRMGAGKEKAFSLKHEGVFDYATSIHRTELLDIYLAANCAFAISTQTGPDAVCLLFRRPVCFVDIPLFSQFFFGTGLAFWNPTVYSQRGRKLSLREIIDADLLWEKSTEELLAKQIEGVRSTPIEIQQNVMGFVEMYESGFVLTKQQEIVLDEANLIISSGMGLEGETVFGQIQARFNPPFLTRNAEWFLR
jgi:putative glycosyltransferase (TIGR04372 family)